MAFDRLDANRTLIERLQGEGRTLTGIADELSRQKRIETTPASVSRYLKSIGKPQRSRELSGDEQDGLDVAAVLIELLAEVRGRGDEQRQAIEQLACQLAVFGSQVAQLESRIALLTAVHAGGAVARPQSVEPPKTPGRAISVIVAGVLAAGLAVAGWLMLGR